MVWQRYFQFDCTQNVSYFIGMNTEDSKRPDALVLLVDENPETAKIVTEALSNDAEHPFHVLWERSPDKAIQTLTTRPEIDIIINDFRSSDIESWEFCLQLNQSGIQKPLVLIIDTKNFRATVEAMKLGVEDILFQGDLERSQLPKTIASIIDRTQLRSKKQAIDKRMLLAENQARAIRELVVTVCHEFNNPLAAIKISSDLLKRQFTENPQAQLLQEFNLHFNEIDAEIKRLRDLNFEHPTIHEVPRPLNSEEMKKTS